MNINEIQQLVVLLFEKFGYLIVFLGSLIEITPLGWAVPGGLILFLAGYISNGDKNLNFAQIVLFGAFGAWIALLLAYLLGKYTGNWLIKKLHQEKAANLAKKMLKENGEMILTTSLLANLTRFWISYIAGLENYNFLKFNIHAYVASLTWVILTTSIGFFAGYEKGNIEKFLNGLGVFGWILVVIAFLILIKSIKHIKDKS